MRSGLPHTARSFPSLPDAQAAYGLLDAVAGGACDFAPSGADKPIALYGGGDMGGLARDFLRAVGLDVALVIDRNARALAGQPEWRGLSVLHPDEVSDNVKRDMRIAVSLVLSPYVPVERDLLARGFRDVVPFYDLAEGFRDLHPLSNGWFAPPFDDDDRSMIRDVLARWHDDASRAHHLQFLAWRRVREEWSFGPAPLMRKDRYFIPEIRAVLRADESFVDGGAYQGSVVETLAQAVPAPFREVIAFEPDPASRAQLTERLAALFGKDGRIRVLDAALAEAVGEARFHGGLGYASQLAATGRTTISTVPLDAFGLTPSFIKLHLEGGELPALKGARATLAASRPILAVTVYHNADGLWRTPHWLMQSLPDYRFLFRVDSWCGTGAVVYGIPEERFGR